MRIGWNLFAVLATGVVTSEAGHEQRFPQPAGAVSVRTAFEPSHRLGLEGALETRTEALRGAPRARS